MADLGELELRDPSDVRVARHAVERAFGSALGDDELDRALLALSELATNAIDHGRPRCFVAGALDALRLRIEVVDSSPATPMVRSPTELEQRGRGLRIVSAVTDRWGCDALPSGKRVWFEIDRLVRASSNGAHPAG